MKHVRLNQGDTVAVHVSMADDIKYQYGFEEAQKHENYLRNYVLNQLTERGITATPSSPNSLNIVIQDMDKGNSTMRQWGPAMPFGGQMGDSKLSGHARLIKNGQKREIEMSKKGSTGGILSADDQTNENFRYMAQSLLAKITM